MSSETGGSVQTPAETTLGTATDSEELASTEEAAGPPDKPNTRLGGWLIAVGLFCCAGCLVSLSALAGRLVGDPVAMPPLLVTVVIALAFQVGFSLYACGLATLGRQVLYLYLPVMLVCCVLVGLVSGFVGYMVTSGPSDYKYLKPQKLDYGWEFQGESSGIKDCSVTYTRKSFMAGGDGKSTLRITVPRRRTGPMIGRAWQAFVASVEAQGKSKEEGPIRRTRSESKEIRLCGQPGYKVVDEMSAPRGMGFTNAAYWWYSPAVDRLVTCVVVLEGGGGSWELESVEKMLNSIPTE